MFETLALFETGVELDDADSVDYGWVLGVLWGRVAYWWPYVMGIESGRVGVHWGEVGTRR